MSDIEKELQTAVDNFPVIHARPDYLFGEALSEIQQLRARNAALKEDVKRAAVIGYKCGHNDTVESNYCDPAERAEEIISEDLKKQDDM